MGSNSRTTISSECLDLGLDQACLNIVSNITEDTWLYGLQANCVTCPYSLLSNISSGEEKILKLSTHHSWTFRVSKEHTGEYQSVSNTNSTYCNDIKWNLGTNGIYHLMLSGEDKCDTKTIEEPINIYTPLVVIICILIAIGVIHKLGIIAIKKFTKNKNEDKNVLSEPTKQRIKSLDTFRGICILLMIFVNDGAGGYEILEHATWNGLQLADLVFPWFVWIMGVCIPISIKSQLKKNVSRLNITKTVFRRSLILFGLGLMLNTLGVGAQLETLRIFGVFQRFGVLYFIVGTTCAFLWPRINDQGMSGCRDIILVLPQWILHIIIHITHLLIIFLLYVPDCPSGYFGPGGISENGIHYNCTGGATGYIDMLILQPQHLYQNPSTKIVYKSGPFDPEGPYGSLPSLLSVMLGVQAGAILISYPAWKARVKRWLIWGFVCLILGIILWVTDSIPVNKNLWSTSFTLVTGGLAFLLLVFCYMLIDVWGIWQGSPFIYPGMNSTIMYVGHMVAYNLWPFHWYIGDMDTHLILLIENIWGVALWTFIAFRLYCNKFFLSI